MTNFTSGAVIYSEHSYWSTDDFSGFIIPSPPRRQGSAKTSRSVSDIVLRPVIAGIDWCRMTSFKGVRSFPMRCTAATFSSSERFAATFTEQTFNFSKYARVRVRRAKATFSLTLRFFTNFSQVLARTLKRGQHLCMQDQKCIVFMTRRRRGTSDLRTPCIQEQC